MLLDSLLVLYGSQTGTAEDIAARFSRSGKRRGYNAIRVMAMDDYDKVFTHAEYASSERKKQTPSIRIFIPYVRSI
jgi:sulfite reductase alpha subunit-like flavoprotein